MKTILIHGFGQQEQSWNETISFMQEQNNLLCPNLTSLLNGQEATYEHLYQAMAQYCQQIDEPVNLCGISLGGILALDFALEFPNLVNSLVLIATPHQIPKMMFALQNMIFRFLPASAFEDMAFSKKDTFVLLKSTKDLDFKEKVKNISCPVLIICGKKDKTNVKSAQYLYTHIKDAKLILLESTGHAVNEEQPQQLAQILQEFLMNSDNIKNI